MTATGVVRLYLVRHGRAAAGWDDEPDPPLDPVGLQQAASLAIRFAPLGPLPILVSPLRRCRETARPLADAWAVEPAIEPAVAEIPPPEGVPMGERMSWLRAAMAGTWADLGPRYVTFRDGVVARLRACPTDTVVVSHLVAINAAIGAALGDDRVVIELLDNCSVTVVEVVGGRLRLVARGLDADPLTR